MKIQKESFYISVVLILVLAALMAFYFQPLTDNFVIPVVLSFLKINGPPAAYAHYFSPDVAFLAFFAIICLVILRFSQRPEPLVYIIYAASMFFCFFYVLIAPIESILVMCAFFVPVFMWHQKKFGNIVLFFIAVVLIATSWLLLGKPAVFLLMLPMCHLLAIRASNSLQSRYSGKEVRVMSRLSSTQKSKVAKNHSIFKQDLWDIIGPEIEALAESWQKVKTETIDHKEIDEDDDFTSRISRPVYSHLLEIQSQHDLNQSVKAIQQRDSGFLPDVFLQKFEDAFKKIQMACYEQKTETIQQMVSDALYEQFKCRVDEQKDAGVRFSCERLNIMGRKIARVSCDKNFDAIHIMVTAEVEEIARDLKTNEILNPENKKQKICEYWSFIRRPSAKTLKKPGLIEGSCPNCGAPIEIGQATVCPVCKSYLRSGYYDWVLAKITQACEWEYANPKLVPGYNDIIRVDSDFSIHQIEDRCAVIFWMLRLVERRQTMDPILRFATEKCCQGFRFMMRGVKKYTYLENVSFASATLKVVNVSEQSQRIYVLVVYSGIPVTCTAEGRLPTLHRFSKPKRDVLVFVRKPDQKTNLNNTLTSAHCHNCGGPLTSNYAINCSYCNALLIDGSEWLLEKVLSEQSHEYLEQSSKKQELIQKAVKETKKKKEEIKIKRSGRDVISIAAEVLVADGKVEESEMEMLEKLASMYAMPKDQLKGIVEAAKQGEIHVPEPENIKESKAIIEAAIEMALVDGNLADEERDSIEKVGKKLGYAKPDLKMMFTKAINKQSLAKRKKKI